MAHPVKIGTDIYWACCVSDIGPTCKHREGLEPIPAEIKHRVRFEEYRAREYGRHAAPEGTKLELVPSWGRDGWDLGEWPYVRISHGTMPDGRHVVRYYCEGDVDYYVTPDEATQNAVTDYLAWFHWNSRGRVESFEDMPPERRGPFSWARLDAETAG